MSSSTRPPFQKKKVAVLFGYCGTGYSGLQFNPGASTVESVLWEAAVKAGMVWERNADDSRKVDWQRACRTDKGVHAAGNVVSFKGLLVKREEDAEWLPQYVVKQLNKNLPEGIRIFDVIKVTNSFDSHTQCDSRFYEYLFPTALLQQSSLEQFFNRIETSSASDVMENSEENVKVSPDDLQLFQTFRLNQKHSDRLLQLLSLYIGTRSFHNFTIGKPPSDPSSQRYIRSFIAQDPFIDDHSIEWIRLRIHGASFMLHQIRKMVGLVILAVRFSLSDSLVTSALSASTAKMNVPKAPGVGLYLDRAVFDGYNKYIGGGSAPHGVPDKPIDLEAYEEEREALKRELIYPAILRPGVGAFVHWLMGLEAHSYEFEYLKDHTK